MDILQAYEVISNILDSHNANQRRVADAMGFTPGADLTLSAEQRAFVIQLLQRFSREPLTTKGERAQGDLGQLLLCLNMLIKLPGAASAAFPDAAQVAAIKDMVAVAGRAYFEARTLCTQDLQPESKEVLAWVQALLVSENASRA